MSETKKILAHKFIVIDFLTFHPHAVANPKPGVGRGFLVYTNTCNSRSLSNLDLVLPLKHLSCRHCCGHSRKWLR